MLEQEGLGPIAAPCGDVERIQIIANILKHLNGKELLEARLASRDINCIVCSHPTLLWNKIMLLISTQPAEETESNLENLWPEIRLFDLITRYECPNFHLHQANLLSPGAQRFFDSSVRYQIKHLKLTDCKVTGDTLLHILSCVSNSLKHLEIVGWDNFTPNGNGICSRPYLHSLSTIVLQSQLNEDNEANHQRTGSCVSLSFQYLQLMFRGAKLKDITFTGWRSETCQNFLNVLISMPPRYTESLECLELFCVVERGLPARKQYSFIKCLQDLVTPSLQTLTIRLDRQFDGVRGLTNKLVEDLTNSLAIFIENSGTNLEVIDLINCPVGSEVLRSRPSSLSNLHRINTRGSFITEVDGEGISTDENVNRPLRRRISTSRRDPEVLERAEISESGPVPGTTQPLQSDLWKQRDLCLGSCLLIIFAIVLHLGLQRAFGNVGQVEVFIHAGLGLGISKRREIMELWSNAQNRIHDVGVAEIHT